MTTLNINIPWKSDAPDFGPLAKLCAEVVTEGNGQFDDPLCWYVDAAWIELADGTKARDLSEDEIQLLDDDKNPTFSEAVGEAYSEWAEGYDPTE